jgi:Domain of unknown function (DUF4157)/Toxin with a conserved tryptophan and TIP tripeptide motif
MDGRSHATAVMRTTGDRLPTDVQTAAGRRFGHDFSGVRVHHDRAAASSARQLGASAYTIGNHVVFAAGAFAPGSSAGRRLLEHELVHVVQQRNASLTNLRVSDPSSSLEAEADRLSTQGPSESPAQVRGLALHQHFARQTASHPDPDCDDLLIQIVARALELYLRADALVRNPLNLPQTGPMSIEGHQQQFRNKQANLRSMLNQWDNNNCGDGYIPQRAWEWATRPVPSPNAQLPVRRVPIASGGDGERSTKPVSGLTPAEAAVATGATIGAGYLLYRAIRFLPSLLPPLWPTIPANAVVP